MPGKVIYDPAKDPLMKKKIEWHKQRYKRDKMKLYIYVATVLFITAFLSIFIIMNFPNDSELNKVLWLLIVGALLAVVSFFAMIMMAKVIYLARMNNIKILEDGLLYEFSYVPYWLDREGKTTLFIPYEDIVEIERKISSRKRLKYLDIKVAGKTLERYGNKLDGWLGICEENVPDLDIYEKIVREQWERYKSKEKKA